MRSEFVLMVSIALVSAPAALADDPRSEVPESAAKEISGKIVEPKLSVEPGSAVKPGATVSVSFDYETLTPGEVQATIVAMGAGKAIDSIRSSVFPLKRKTGLGVVALYLRGPNDREVDEFRIVVLPTSGGQKGRVASTIKASVRFLGDMKAFAQATRFLYAQVDPANRDRLLLRTHSAQAARDDKKAKPSAPPEPDIQVNLKDVLVFHSDASKVEAKDLPDLLKNARSIVAVPNGKANAAVMQIFQFNLLVLVVPAGTFDDLAAKEAKDFK